MFIPHIFELNAPHLHLHLHFFTFTFMYNLMKAALSFYFVILLLLPPFSSFYFSITLHYLFFVLVYIFPTICLLIKRSDL